MPDDDNGSVTSGEGGHGRRRARRNGKVSREGSVDSKMSVSEGGTRRPRRTKLSFDEQAADASKPRPNDEDEIQSERGSKAGSQNGRAREKEGSQAGSKAGSVDEEQSNAQDQENGSTKSDAAATENAPGRHLGDEDDNDTTVLQVHIHATDELKAHIHLRHPVIRLSIVNADDGQLMTKPNKNRNVVQQHENSTTITTPGGSKSKGAHSDGEDGGEPMSPVQGESKGYDKILPVITQPYDLSLNLRDGRSLSCEWEETIGFDERLRYFNDSKYLFMFELLDFVHTRDDIEDDNLARKKKRPGKVRKDFWVRIAWSFVRPNDRAGSGGRYVHLGKKLRLQLYKYRKFWFYETIAKRKCAASDCQAYWQWKMGEKHGSWQPYKSTLYVTMEGIERPNDTIRVANRSRLPWEIEEGNELSLTMSKQKPSLRKASETQADLDTTRLGSRWLNASGPWCRVPNVSMHKLDSDHRGCFVLAFSTYGTFLACATGGRQMYKIKIYNVANGALAATLPGHHEIVYDLEWGNILLDELSKPDADDSTADNEGAGARDGAGDGGGEGGAGARPVRLGKLLLSASADTTAKMWDVDSRELVAACHHPSYVYAARFCPGPDGIKKDGTEGERALSACTHVITGCYDHSLRLWDVQVRGSI